VGYGNGIKKGRTSGGKECYEKVVEKFCRDGCQWYAYLITGHSRDRKWYVEVVGNGKVKWW